MTHDGCRRSRPSPGRRPIDLDQFQRARELFFDALELPAPERAAFVAGATDDAALRDEVLDLLQFHEARAAAETALPEAIGPYRVIARLGEGGMGVVYRADGGGGRAVAIKVLPPGVLGDRMASRLAREAAALKRLDHFAIARFIDSGSHRTSYGAQPYIVMELVEGVPLHAWAGSTAADARARLALIAEVCDAVQHAHERGVIHRDLKPSNIVVDAAGRPHVLDFGIARITGSDLRESTLTHSGELLGTVRYMSPEQAQGLAESVDARTDIYALGVIAYELLAGRLPYDLPTRSLTRALVMVATTEPAPVGRHQPALRGAVESILERALQKRPQDRYASAAAMAADIRRHLGERPVAAATGRLWRRARGLLRRRPLAAALMVTAIVAVPIAALTVPPLRHRLPIVASDDLVRLGERLQAADIALHVDRPTVAQLDSLRGAYEAADDMLASYPASDPVLDLRRLVHWRLGEACYLLGARLRDAPRLVEASRWFALSGNPERPRGYHPSLPLSFPLYGSVADLRPEQAASGGGMVEAELGSFREPLFHARRALASRAAVLGIYARSIGQAGVPPLAVQPVTPIEGYGLSLNEYGETLSWIGLLADSVALIDRALACFARADSLERNGAERIAYASLLYNRGRAYLWRAERTSHAADLDSAEAFLDAALTLRDEARRPSRVEAHLALSQVFRARARLDPRAAHTALARASTHASAAWRVLEEDRAPPAARLPALVGRAACALDRCERLGEAGALGQATRDLDLAADAVDDDRAPYPAACYALERARLERLRWQVEPTLEGRAVAIAALERARDAMPRDQDQEFNRRVAAEAARLGIPLPR